MQILNSAAKLQCAAQAAHNREQGMLFGGALRCVACIAVPTTLAFAQPRFHARSGAVLEASRLSRAAIPAGRDHVVAEVGVDKPDKLCEQGRGFD